MTAHSTINTALDRLALTGEVKLLAPDDAKAGEVTGYGAIFGNVDLGGDVIEPGAFAATIKARGARPLPMLWSHDQAKPIGSWTRIAEDARGLVVRGKINTDTAAGREARALILAGDVSGLSIGYSVSPGGAVFDAAGKRKLKRLDLHEVSIVSVPMNPAATVTGAKSADQIASLAGFRDFLVKSGFPRRAAERLAAGGWPALNPTTTDDTKAAALVAALKAASAAFQTKG
jgi:uncharacterized protein